MFGTLTLLAGLSHAATPRALRHHTPNPSCADRMDIAPDWTLYSSPNAAALATLVN